MTVSAKKKDWIDKTYKFSDVQNVLICKIDDSIISALDDALDEEIQLRGRKFEKKLKRPILDEDSDQLADIKIVTKIIQWENSSRYVPEKFGMKVLNVKGCVMKMVDGKKFQMVTKLQVFLLKVASGK